jgi:hypothetical protein
VRREATKTRSSWNHPAFACFAPWWTVWLAPAVLYSTDDTDPHFSYRLHSFSVIKSGRLEASSLKRVHVRAKDSTKRELSFVSLSFTPSLPPSLPPSLSLSLFHPRNQCVSISHQMSLLPKQNLTALRSRGAILHESTEMVGIGDRSWAAYAGFCRGSDYPRRRHSAKGMPSAHSVVLARIHRLIGVQTENQQCQGSKFRSSSPWAQPRTTVLLCSLDAWRFDNSTHTKCITREEELQNTTTPRLPPETAAPTGQETFTGSGSAMPCQANARRAASWGGARVAGGLNG